jgi:sulfopropanediol 3-dehydrogenase
MVRYLKCPECEAWVARQDVKRTVSEILLQIERRGSHAVREYSHRLDGWDPPSFRVGDKAIATAAEQVPPELRRQISDAQQQVRGFARAQRETMTDLEIQPADGITIGHRHVPVGNVGAYVPGGRYPMLASAFMTILTAKVAGVPRVVASAPPRQAEGIHPYMLYAMASSGADEILCLGGVQALAAMAYGIEGLEPVDMIVGPGNVYVAEAKRQLFGRVGIDLVAGPTEIVVIADRSADPELVAADLLGQAEHGPDSPAGLIAVSEDLGLEVLACVERLLETWPTAEVSREAWRNRGWVAVVAGDQDAVDLANRSAPEHLEVQVEESKLGWYLDRLVNYGGLFLGDEATVVYGDKAIGTNHVLPTGGAARYTGGLWVGMYLKTLTYQRVGVEGTRRIAPAAMAISNAEHFAGHAVTAEMRLERAARRIAEGAG